MSPQDASSLVAKLEEFFKDFTPAVRELLLGTFEQFPFAAARSVISRSAAETSTFDRGKLLTLLREEQARQTRRVSPSIAWNATKTAEAKAIDEALNSLPMGRLKQLGDDVRLKRPAILQFLKGDLLQTDIGRSLIYEELRCQEAK